MKHKTIVLASATLLLWGCATPPVDRGLTNSRAFDLTYEQVWESLVGFFAARNIQVKNIAKDSGVIFAERTSFDATMADCGHAGLWRPTARRAGFNVFVTRSGLRPVVTVNSEFVEIRRLFDQVDSFQCVSTGLLEQGIFNSIGTGLAAPVELAPAMKPTAPAIVVAPPIAPATAPAVPVPAGVVPAGVVPLQPPASQNAGRDSYQVERMPEVRACTPSPRVTLSAKGPGTETYLVACANGDSLMVRCDLGNCRVLR